MNRIGVRAAAVLVAGLLVGATACGGGSSDESSSNGDAVKATAESSTTTTESSSDTGDLSDLSDLGDSMDALGGDCMSTGLAFLSLTMAPLGFMGGASQEDIDKLKTDLDDLSGEIPDEIRSDFETYAEGIEAYANAMEGMSLENILDPEVQSQMEEAGAMLETPEMEAASANIEAYFDEACTG